MLSWLWPYCILKVDFCLNLYVFLGYSLAQSTYVCLDHFTSKICLSSCKVCQVIGSLLFSSKFFNLSLVHHSVHMGDTYFASYSHLPLLSSLLLFLCNDPTHYAMITSLLMATIQPTTPTLLATLSTNPSDLTTYSTTFTTFPTMFPPHPASVSSPYLTFLPTYHNPKISSHYPLPLIPPHDHPSQR